MSGRIEADVVVVGAGSAGCVLATRLVEAGAGRVVLIEAGPDSRDPRLSIPLMTGVLLRQKRYNWAFTSEPVPELDGRRLDWPRGKVVGGSGAINGMVHARGLSLDYDGWAQSGLTDWSWERVRPYFEKAEGAAAAEGGATLALSRPDWWHPLYDAFLDAADAAGLGRTDDLNAPDAVGAGRYAFTIERGRRASTARRYLDRVRETRDFRLIAGAQVLGLSIARGRCTGVAIDRGAGAKTVAATREVVLCAGTVGSPHLLMLSGVGPGETLAAHGIPVAIDRPAVGANLHDHLLVRVEYESRRQGPLAPLLRLDRAALAVARAWLTGRGPAACFPLLVGGYFRSRPDLEAPDLQAHFLPALSSATLRTHPFRRPEGARAEDGFFANIAQMRPESRGRVTLASADPRAAPRIEPRYLSTPTDRRCLRDGVRLLRDLFAQPAFDPWRGRELAPGPGTATDDEIDAWIRQTANTVYHPVGTCRMGVDAAAVVGPDLRVRGVDGLRVADASVMPSIPSANTQAPVVMIAEKAADLILGR